MTPYDYIKPDSMLFSEVNPTLLEGTHEQVEGHRFAVLELQSCICLFGRT